MTYATLKERISAESAERKARYAMFTRIVQDAVIAGRTAAKECTPRMMRVKGSDGQVWDVPDGVCGFAWVSISPGTASFSKWAAKNAGFRKAYGGGLQYWVSDYEQSMERKEAFARAFAKVLNDHAHITKVQAYGQSRMD